MTSVIGFVEIIVGALFYILRLESFMFVFKSIRKVKCELRVNLMFSNFDVK